MPKIGLMLPTPGLALAAAGIHPARGVRSVLLIGVCVPLSVGSAAAQQARGSDGLPLPRVFVGAGAGPSSKDAAARMRPYEDGLAAVWLAEAGAAVSERVGIGVEYAQRSATTAFTTIGAGRAQTAGRQEERMLFAMARVRVAGMNRWALDVVGGDVERNRCAVGVVPESRRPPQLNAIEPHE